VGIAHERVTWGPDLELTYTREVGSLIDVR
jgi:hypothetical protein